MQGGRDGGDQAEEKDYEADSSRGLGVTGVLFSGAVVAGLVLRRNLVSALAKPLPEP